MENRSLRTRVCQAVWPTINFPSESKACHHAQCSGARRAPSTHMYDSFHVKAKLWSEDLHIDTFHGLLAPWQWRTGQLRCLQCDRKNCPVCRVKAEVNWGGQTSGLGSGVCLQYFLFLTCTDSGEKYKHEIQTHTCTCHCKYTLSLNSMFSVFFC